MVVKNMLSLGGPTVIKKLSLIKFSNILSYKMKTLQIILYFESSLIRHQEFILSAKFWNNKILLLLMLLNLLAYFRINQLLSIFCSSML